MTFMTQFITCIKLRKCAKWNYACGVVYPCVFLFAFLIFIKTTYSEFRFCSRGPHKIRETACPGGFIAFKPLNVTCMYYMKGPDISELTVKFDDNLCDGYNESITLDITGETDFSGVTTFQRIIFEYADEFALPSPGEYIPDDTCALECLDSWSDPFIPEDEPMFIDKPTVLIEEKEKLEDEYVNRTRNIFLCIIRERYHFDDGLEDDPILVAPELLENKTDKIYGFQLPIKLLAKSMRIAMVQCSPFIERSYYENILKAMIYLHQSNKVHNMVGMHPVEFHKIYHYLDSCEKETNTRFVLNGTKCDEMHIVDTIVNLDFDSGGPWKYRRQSRSFRWGYYDPIVESAWVAVDFVHGYCFPIFYAAEDVLHFHLYIQAMEALFPFEPVQKHWMYPVKLKKYDFWNAMMESKDIKNQMRNLDACAIAAYLKKAPYQERLLRLFTQPEQIENADYTDTPNMENKGWKKSLEDYWKWYEKQGSFKEISKTLGHCLDGSVEDLETAEKDIMQGSELNCHNEIT